MGWIVVARRGGRNRVAEGATVGVGPSGADPTLVAPITLWSLPPRPINSVHPANGQVVCPNVGCRSIATERKAMSATEQIPATDATDTSSARPREGFIAEHGLWDAAQEEAAARGLEPIRRHRLRRVPTAWGRQKRCTPAA